MEAVKSRIVSDITFICQGKPLHNKKATAVRITPRIHPNRLIRYYYLNGENNPVFNTLTKLIEHYNN